MRRTAVADIRIGSMCSGYGGLDLAAHAVTGGSVAWHAENDPHASRVLAHHWPDMPNLGDLTAVDWATVEPVDVVTAGYPCQPFSHAGQRKGSADDRHLWPHIAAAVRVLRPRLVLLENVAGHVSLGLDAVLGDLAALGFDAAWGCLRAADVGAPHGRARVFIAAAHPDDLGQQRTGAARGRRGGLADSGVAVADASGDGRHDCGCALWGEYAPAVHRWEMVLGRLAPAPTQLSSRGKHQLSALAVEWMMGLPAGHVTDPAIWAGMRPSTARGAQLTILGNGVVPAQAEAAYRMLLPTLLAEVCAA